jgi:hypothetical protein
MWMCEDALAGRISQGKSHQGNIPESVILELHGKRVYQMHRFFEEEIAKGGEFFRVRWLVLVTEELREAVQKASERDPIFNRRADAPEGVSGGRV